MAKRYIDLTLTIRNNEEHSMFPRTETYGQEQLYTTITSISKSDEWMMHKFEMSTESYTHLHVPRNLFDKGWAIEDVPVEYLFGEAVVIDMTHKKEKEAITAADFEKAAPDIREGDMAIVRTGWSDKMWGKREFWINMPYLAEDGCAWLVERKITNYISDTYNDLPFGEPCPHCGKLMPLINSGPNHEVFLKNNVLLAEYVTNLGAITQPRVEIACLPIKLSGVGQAPCRVVAIEEV